MAGKKGSRKKTYTFEPGSKKLNDPDIAHDGVTDTEISTWVADLLKLAKAPQWTTWELDFIRQMSQRKTFTGKQVVLLRQYIGRLIQESAQDIVRIGD